MNVGIKLKPIDSALSADSLADDPLPGAEPLTPASPVTLRLQAHYPHLVQCQHCRALNGLSAPACWNCEAELSASRRSTHQGQPTPEHAGLASVPPPVAPPPAAHALDTMGPTPEPEVHTLVGTDASAPAPAPEPMPPATLEAMHPMVLRLRPAAPAPWRKRVTTAAVALALVAGVDVYLRFQASPSDTLDAAVMSGSALLSRGAVSGPDAVEARLGGSASTPASTRFEGAASVAANPVNIATNAQAAAEPPPRALTRTTRPVRLASRSKEPRTTSASGSVRPPPQAPAAVEPAREKSAPAGPCTAAVAALGLCAAPLQPKE